MHSHLLCNFPAVCSNKVTQLDKIKSALARKKKACSKYEKISIEEEKRENFKIKFFSLQFFAKAKEK